MRSPLFSIVVFSILFVGGVSSALACKMTAMGSSSRAMKAVVNTIETNTQLGDREIKKIRQVNVKDVSWAYVVETTKDGKGCQAIGYQVKFEPSCQVVVQKLNTRFHCLS